MEELRVRLGFDYCFAVDCQGRGGGLALLWKRGVNCDLVNYSMHLINVDVHDDRCDTWRLTLLYGFPKTSHRRDSWALLRSLVVGTSSPWCVIGDFNELFNANDKKGHREQPNWLFSGFWEVVVDCELVNVPLEGYLFTWSKSLGTNRAVEERLDRAPFTNSWMVLFPRLY